MSGNGEGNFQLGSHSELKKVQEDKRNWREKEQTSFSASPPFNGRSHSLWPQMPSGNHSNT